MPSTRVARLSLSAPGDHGSHHEPTHDPLRRFRLEEPVTKGFRIHRTAPQGIIVPPAVEPPTGGGIETCSTTDRRGLDLERRLLVKACPGEHTDHSPWVFEGRRNPNRT